MLLMARRYGDRIVVQRAPIVQNPRTGNEVPDWAQATTSEPLAADVQPAGQSELNDNRQLTITRWTVVCDPADIVATDRVVWRGDIFDVDGEVGMFMRHGVPHHLEFTLKRFSQ